MTKWLASVQSLQEAHALSAVLPDILDMKDPAKGALGALSVSTVSQIVKMVDGRCQTSATIGDLAMEAQQIAQAMTMMAESGVDYVKIGLFPDNELRLCIRDLAPTVSSLNTPVIAVIFADKPLQLDVLPLLKEAGFHGVMVDTAIKNGQHLQDHWDEEQLTHFVQQAEDHQLLCGLAGALRLEDISTLSSFGADYLGFRSALCDKRQRTSSLQAQLASQVKEAIEAERLALLV